MKTIETVVYTFDELKPEAKEKARAWYREGQNYPYLEEYMREQLEMYLKREGIEFTGTPNVLYSLSYCQGDGAMFEGHLTYKGQDVVVEHVGRYYHKYSKQFTWPDFVGEEMEQKEEKIATAFEAVYLQICSALEKDGYAYIEAEDSDENVDENIRINEYTFTADGKRFG